MPAHSHTGSTSEAGSHIHSGTSSPDGLHVHEGTTDTEGSHNHSYDIRASTRPGSFITEGSHYFAGNMQTLGTRNTNTNGAHSHELNIDSAGIHSHDLNIEEAGAHNHTFTTDEAGGGNPHNILQPYIVLNFIIKY